MPDMITILREKVIPARTVTTNLCDAYGATISKVNVHCSKKMDGRYYLELNACAETSSMRNNCFHSYMDKDQLTAVRDQISATLVS